MLGRPIEAVHFTPPGYAKPRPPALLFGAIHGDEPVTPAHARAARRRADRAAARTRHVDRPVRQRRRPARRARATTRTTSISTATSRARAGATQRRPGYNPGAAAEDQPETQALVELIERVGAAAADRAATRRIAWSTGTAAASSSRARWPSAAAIRSSATWAIRRPGSFGAKYGVEREPRGHHARVAVPGRRRDRLARVPRPRCAGASICPSDASEFHAVVSVVDRSTLVDPCDGLSHCARDADAVVARPRSARAPARARRAAPARARAHARRAPAERAGGVRADLAPTMPTAPGSR